MNKTSIFKRALAIGWRVLFVLLLLLTLAGGLAWWLAPDIKTLRPEIESYLQDELELEEVKLGWLSWYWAGHLGITADECSFRTRDGSVEVDGSRIAVYFSFWDMIRGDFLPDSIHLHDGEMHLEVKGDTTGRSLPPARLVLDNMHLLWKAKGYAGDITGLVLTIDSEARELFVRFPGLRAEVALDADGMPRRLAGEFLDVNWVPALLRQELRGTLAGKFNVTRRGDTAWQGSFHFRSDEHAVLSMPEADFTLPLTAIDMDVGMELERHESGDISLGQLAIRSFQWDYGDNSITGKGAWENGKLHLSASTTHVDMPLLWSWLRPLDDGDWDMWLAKMKQGTITRADASVVLVWPEPLRRRPSTAALQTMKYHVKGVVEGADVALGLDSGSIIRTRADVELDEAGLRADISHTEFPDMAAVASGTLLIPWETLVLDITGKGEADAGKLHAWLDADGANALRWSAAPATGEFHLVWMPEEEKPRDVTVELQLKEAWQANPNGVPLTISRGSVTWGLKKGLQLTDMAVETPHLAGTFSAKALHQSGRPWQIAEFKGMGEGSLAKIAGDFHLPVEAPAGNMSITLALNGEWHGVFDFTDAAWSNLLGIRKKTGDPFRVRFIGSSSRQGVVDIKDIACQEKQLRLRGEGAWSDAGLKLDLQQISTDMFEGNMKVNAPFGPDPWELDVHASYLNRKALPKRLNWNRSEGAKPWALRADIGRFDWDDARMDQTSIRLASAANSVGVFKANAIQTEALKLDRVSAMFALPGAGRVDLRHFTASLDHLNLVLSATLTPDADSGVRWSGFATLNGNFGDMLKRAELSNLFEDGDMYVLFSGQGVLLREQPWWKDLSGRLRLRVSDGRIMKGGTLSKLLAAVNVMELPGLFSGDRKDLTEEGLFYRRLQSEAVLQGKDADIRQFALRSPAMDIAGHGKMDVAKGHADMIFVARPFQNLDALLAKVPIVRDLFGGSAHSLVRRIYHMYGPVADATVEEISPEEAGLASPGIVEHLLGLPNQWFGKDKKEGAF